MLSQLYLLCLLGFLTASAKPKLNLTSTGISSSRYNSCTELWFSQEVDHFSRRVPQMGNTHWQHRYYICDKYWKSNKPKGSVREEEKAIEGINHPIFFYAGQEADLQPQVGQMGLLWDFAPKFGALLLFVEHRYYGASQPFGENSIQKDPSYLSTEQVLADYATVIEDVKSRYGGFEQPVVAFGGSYGAMLATYMRLKYPHIVSATVSSSGPVGCFPDLHPPYDPSTYWQVVTHDATEAAGSPKFCAQNVRNAFKTLFGMQSSKGGLESISKAFNLCEPLKDEDDVLQLAYVVQGAFDAMAMYNYPFPLFGMPAYPFKTACEFLSKEDLQGVDLLEGLAKANWVYYSTQMPSDCLSLLVAGPAAGDPNWEYLMCTERLPQEQPYWPTNGVTDMFWDQGNFTAQDMVQHCMKEFGITPRQNWASIQYGGKKLKSLSNVVFYNGLLDPWSTGGILQNLSDTLVAVVLPMGGHHVEIWGEQPDDSPMVRGVREKEMEYVWKWVMEPQMRGVAEI